MLGEAWKLELEGFTGAGVETGVEEAEVGTGGCNQEGTLGQAGAGGRGTGASLGIGPAPGTGGCLCRGRAGRESHSPHKAPSIGHQKADFELAA